MDIKAEENTDCCADGCCGCHIDAYPTSRECPQCGKRLRLAGRAQLAEFRLNCVSCGYTGPVLSMEEVGDLL
jgi:ribosomal protein S27AE